MARGFPSSHFRSILLLIALCSCLGFGLDLARAKEKHIMANKRKETKKERRAAAKRK